MLIKTVGVCSDPQNTVCSGSDGYRHLIVLDAGWLSLCPPKILVYDFITNRQVSVLLLKNSISLSNNTINNVNFL